MNGYPEEAKCEFVPDVNQLIGIRKKEKKSEWQKRYRETHKEQRAEYTEKNREHINAKSSAYQKANYHKTKERSKRYANENKEKIRDYKKDHYKKNKVTILAKNKKWREDNAESIKVHKREYARREETRESRSEYFKMKRKTDPKYKLSAYFRIAIKDSIKSGQKRGLLKVLGYTMDDLKKHLEKQFEPWMSWENHGEWHIDHKIPVSAFNYETVDDIDFKKCWALKNLRPLKAFDNLSKSNKLDKPFQPSLNIAA
jgi:hypothetical protein